jgi:hypothetical protein
VAGATGILMQRRRHLVSPLLANTIESAIQNTPASQFSALWTAGGTAADRWFIIKYVPTKYCRDYRPDVIAATAGAGPGPRLRISESPGFTWGTGNYVAPLQYPVSTAIYGRAGIVAELDRSNTVGWRLFDARLSSNQDLYAQWMIRQPAFKWLTLTCHANLANRFLRNAFREAFLIDCVVFHPDQRNAYYTSATDVWMCVSDWTAQKRIAHGVSAVLLDPRLAILVSEEFAPIGHDVRRRSLIGPRGALPSNATLAGAIRHAYTNRDVMELST